MTTLLAEKSLDHIRRHWDEYISRVRFGTPEFDILWNAMCERLNIRPDQPYVETLKSFISNHSETEYRIPNLNNVERSKLHALCDKIGLYHESAGTTRADKTLVVSKPNVWLWDYTKPNRSRGFKTMYCNRCLISGDRNTLLCSVHFNFLVCHNCCRTKLGDDGEPLDCHKWEPAYSY
jgi:hypothetical protein